MDQGLKGSNLEGRKRNFKGNKPIDSLFQLEILIYLKGDLGMHYSDATTTINDLKKLVEKFVRDRE